MSDPLEILIADDHPIFRSGLHQALESEAGFRIVAEAATGQEAVELAGALQPDVVIMDLRMPQIDGIEATRRITADSPHVAVLVLTMFDDDDSVFSAIRAGARGYLVKGADQVETTRAVQAVANGEAIFSPGVAARMVDYFSHQQPHQYTLAFPQLSERERQVLDLLAQGVPNPDIARQLFLSPKTIRNHVSNIFTKLQVTDRAQAIIRAREAGLGRSAARTAAGDQ